LKNSRLRAATGSRLGRGERIDCGQSGARNTVHGPTSGGLLRKLPLVIGCNAILVLDGQPGMCNSRHFRPDASIRYRSRSPSHAGEGSCGVAGNKEKALETFNKGEAGFRDRDVYVFCANVSDGVLTAHPYLLVTSPR
jgi:hypothetical protein